MLTPKNGSVTVENRKLNYIRFGGGDRTLVMLPGLGDGLRSVRGLAMPMALMYRRLTGHFTVWMFSAGDPLPQPCTIGALAEDLIAAWDILGLRNVNLLGVSMGGMLAQELTLRAPEKVERLILTVTAPEPNPLLEESVRGWIGMAGRGDYRGIMLDTAERSYSEAYLKKAKLGYTLFGNMGRPSSFDRFLAMSEACLAHDCRERLGAIRCPTLVIGGEKDRALGAEASRELAERIPGSELFLYPQYSHALYEEAGDFLARVDDFFMGQ